MLVSHHKVPSSIPQSVGQKVLKNFILMNNVSPCWQIFLLSCFIPPEYEKSQRMTEFEFLSNVGGLCGLCLGFSLISGVEILYWIIIKIVRNTMLQIWTILINQNLKHWFLFPRKGRLLFLSWVESYQLFRSSWNHSFVMEICSALIFTFLRLSRYLQI